MFINIDQEKDIDDNTLIRKASIPIRLDEFYNGLSHGALIRSCVDDIKGGECNHQYFKSLDNHTNLKM